MAYDGITMKAICHQLNEILVDGKIDKISQAEKDEILLSIRANYNTYKLLISANSSNPRVYITSKYEKENPIQAPMFLMLLRKHIGGGKILKVIQKDMERIMEIQISAYDELRTLKTKSLIVEIMGKHSNIILVDTESNIVIDAIKRVPITLSSVREVLPNREYLPAPTQDKYNPTNEYSFDNFKHIITHPPQDSYKAIYTHFTGVSPSIAREICYRAGVDTSANIVALNEIKYEKLFDTFTRFFNDVKDNKFFPCLVEDESTGKVIEFSPCYLSHLESFKMKTADNISYICEEYYYTKDVKERINQKTQGLRKSLQIKIDRLRNKYNKQLEELEEAKNLEHYKKLGNLLTANIYLLKQGMDKITVIDYFDENQSEITIPLDKRLNPSGNVQNYFKRYTKLKHRLDELTSQIKQTKEDLDYLDNIMLSISNADSLLEIDEIKQELYKQGFTNHSVEKKKNSKKSEPSKPLEFMSTDGILIYVGKNNTQNDYLTFQVAEPTDVWLHTKNIPGSHVIIKGDFDVIPDQTVREAAILAAYYSKARGSDKVPVDYTIKKNIRKPNSAKPGFVVYDTNYTTYAKPDEIIVEKLKIKNNEE